MAFNGTGANVLYIGADDRVHSGIRRIISRKYSNPAAPRPSRNQPLLRELRNLHRAPVRENRANFQIGANGLQVV